ncbi:MAG: sigma-70 family RNA polymerase sigma factor [Oscillibacter sp.]|jgi:RNA polymerase sigma-70 factor (ECF subfamily)|nr:sigma-70 family RNA polymerase sigma factor [Oscillibacter sp.]
MNDEEIIHLYWGRSESAIEQTGVKYGAACRSTARRILPDVRDAEECVSDALMRLWNAIPPEHPRCLRAYLLRVVRNLALDKALYNSAGKRASALETSFEELEPYLAGEDSADQMMEQQELQEFLRRFLASQSKDNRVIFVRRYWYGESVQEIAQALHVSEGTVKSSLFRTRSRLRESMRKEELSR